MTITAGPLQPGELVAALANNELVVHYQPQTSLVTGRTHGLEALVRWNHPARGMLSPDTFLPLAEECGLQLALTYDVLSQAISEAASWWAAGSTVAVSVNVTPTDLIAPHLLDAVEALLARHDLPATALRLEITEQVAISDPVAAVRVINSLRSAGLQISLDDFGSGMSSLERLRLLPVDEIKIDRALVCEVAEDLKALAIVRSILALARTLKLRVVAEGVETAQEWDQLAREGCELAQGYWQSRPLDSRKAGEWLERDRLVSACADHQFAVAGSETKVPPTLLSIAMTESGFIVGGYAKRAEPLPSGLLASEVDEIFRHDPELTSVLLPLSGSEELTLLSRDQLERWMSGRLGYGRALHVRRPIEELLAPTTVVLDSDMALGLATINILARGDRERFDDVPVRFADGGWGIACVPPILIELANTFAHRSVHDPLTGLPNRVALSMAARKTLEAQTSVAMLYIDLDHFKSVNDTWGHDAGDAVLREVAVRLQVTAGGAGLVARIGGDEFGVLLPGPATSGEAESVGEKIVFVLAAPFHLDGGVAHIGASVGVAVLHPGADPMREAPHETMLTTDELLLRRADEAMYGAKTSGRGRVVPFRPSRRSQPA